MVKIPQKEALHILNLSINNLRKVYPQKNKCKAFVFLYKLLFIPYYKIVFVNENK